MLALLNLKEGENLFFDHWISCRRLGSQRLHKKTGLLKKSISRLWSRPTIRHPFGKDALHLLEKRIVFPGHQKNLEVSSILQTIAYFKIKFVT